jgi:2-keto-4-pentenoate hydratase/2-oxohepta-3-ene-1,7-dioic acid hydratase in catechol pathway
VRLGTVAGRLVLVRAGASGGGAAADGGALEGVDVARASGGRLPPDVPTALGRLDELADWAATAPPTGPDWSAARRVSTVELGPPVPNPRQVFAVALNSRPHAAEAGFTPPADPLVFTKFPSCLTGPVTSVTLPAGTSDWEVELVAVVGRGGHRIPAERAWEALAGLTLGQDLSERVTQSRGVPAQFSLGKSFPGFGPTGPVLVTPDELPDEVSFECSLNGETVQTGRSSEMIFSVAELVARISAVCPLLPGDLIFTGTPAGVGNRRDPPRYLRPGDVLVSRAGGIGELRQTCA